MGEVPGTAGLQRRQRDNTRTPGRDGEGGTADEASEKGPHGPLRGVGLYHKNNGDRLRGPRNGPKEARDLLRAAVMGIKSTGQKRLQETCS